MHQALQARKEEAVVKEDRIESFENMILAYYVYPVTEKF
jgi:hypothetical protein